MKWGMMIGVKVLRLNSINSLPGYYVNPFRQTSPLLGNILPNALELFLKMLKSNWAATIASQSL